MNFTGIDQITYGVEDMQECVRFFDDWGLSKVSVDDDIAIFKSPVGGIGPSDSAPAVIPRGRCLLDRGRRAGADGASTQ